ncbi:SDR family NAD(P)-dependent oxidoreductase [Elusimicrobiota bacterium]
MSDLADKRIVVAGASKGLGYVCAKRLEEEGARLALLARSGARLEKLTASFSDPGRHIAIPGDLADFGKLPELVRKAEDFLSGVDVVLHFVGGSGPDGHLPPWEQVERVFKLNVGIGMEINRLLLPKMVEQGKGNVVHVGSLASSEAGPSVGYNAAKAALAAYVRTVGREVASSGVVVTGILPGAFDAPDNVFARLKKWKPEVVEELIRERLPRRRLGEAEEIVPLVLLLCSDKASMMGGCCVPVDAGEGRTYAL